MGIDLNNTTLVSNSGLTINYGGNIVQTLKTSGALLKYTSGTPLFQAVDNRSAQWIAFTAANWNNIILNSTNFNYQSCYNTSTGAFTAPVTGLYLFQGCACTYAAVPGNYNHFSFCVNGSGSVRIPIAGTLHRIRGQTVDAGGGYWYDGDICEIIPLVAGDYVNYVTYASATNYWYTAYSHWAGVLLG